MSQLVVARTTQGSSASRSAARRTTPQLRAEALQVETPRVETRAPETSLGTRVRRTLGLGVLLGPALVLSTIGRVALVTGALVAWTVWTGPGATDLLGRLNGPAFPLVCLAAAVALALVAWRRPAARPYVLPVIGAVALLPVAAGILLVSPVHLAISMFAGVSDGEALDIVMTLSAAEKAALLPVGPWSCLLGGLACLGLGHGLRRVALGPWAAAVGTDPKGLDLSVASRVVACALLLPVVNLLLLPAMQRTFAVVGVNLPAGTELWLAVCDFADNYGPAKLPRVALALLGLREPGILGLPCWLLLAAAMFVVSLSRSRAIRALPAALSAALLALATLAYGAPIIELLTKL